MPITMSRVNLVAGLGPVLQIAEGWTFELPEKVHDILDSRTDPTWPTTWFAPRLTGTGVFKDGYAVMNAWGANHGAFSYGHIGADLIALASMLRIPGVHAQRAGGRHLPSQRVERLRHGPAGSGRLPRLRELRPAVRAEVSNAMSIDADRNPGRCGAAAGAGHEPQTGPSAHPGARLRARAVPGRRRLRRGLGGHRAEHGPPGGHQVLCPSRRARLVAALAARSRNSPSSSPTATWCNCWASAGTPTRPTTSWSIWKRARWPIGSRRGRCRSTRPCRCSATWPPGWSTPTARACCTAT